MPEPALGWEPLIQFHEFELPPFPYVAFPDWLRDFVGAVATSTQTPVDLAAMLVLATVASACAKKVEVSLRQGYAEPVNLFIVVAMEPGSRKTAVFKKVTEPLEAHERSESARLAPEIARNKSAIKIKEGKLKKLQDRAVIEKSAVNREALTVEAAAIAEELAATAVPVPPRLIADDCTAERLATLLRDQRGRIAVMSAEGDVFDLMAGRYSASSSANFGVYLKGHAGDALRIDRVGRPPEFVEFPALTVGLAVQPEVIRGLVDRPGFRGRGLLGRFLYSLPASLLGRRQIDPPPIPTSIRSTYASKLRRLLEIELGPDNADSPSAPHELRLAPSARARLDEFERWIEPRLSEFGELGGITDWAGKLVGAIGRIAGVLHMATLVDTPVAWDFEISLNTIERAIQIGEYLIPHARASFAEMGADPQIAGAKKILRWIEQGGIRNFTKRDLHQALRATFKRVEDIEPPLAVLLSRGFIRKEDDPKDGPGRRRSPTYLMNPLWCGESARWAAQGGPRLNSEYCEDSEGEPAAQPLPGALETENLLKLADNEELE